MDMTWMPCAASGFMDWPSSLVGRSPATPSISGMLGPYISPSRMPTFAPSAASASARLTAVVDLPTPPLPDAIAMTFFTLSSGLRLRCTPCAVIFVCSVIDTSSISPFWRMESVTARTRSAWMLPAGKPRSMSIDAFFPSTATLETRPISATEQPIPGMFMSPTRFFRSDSADVVTLNL